jgi:hypothetical protein
MKKILTFVTALLIVAIGFSVQAHAASVANAQCISE